MKTILPMKLKFTAAFLASPETFCARSEMSREGDIRNVEREKRGRKNF